MFGIAELRISPKLLPLDVHDPDSRPFERPRLTSRELKPNCANRARSWPKPSKPLAHGGRPEPRATEFGRTPGGEGAHGRDHNPYGFSVWMAGAGIKRGIVHRATDELGFIAVQNRHYVTDIHATLFHQLGLDPRRLEVPGHKRLDVD